MASRAVSTVVPAKPKSKSQPSVLGYLEPQIKDNKARANAQYVKPIYNYNGHFVNVEGKLDKIVSNTTPNYIDYTGLLGTIIGTSIAIYSQISAKKSEKITKMAGEVAPNTKKNVVGNTKPTKSATTNTNKAGGNTKQPKSTMSNKNKVGSKVKPPKSAMANKNKATNIKKIAPKPSIKKGTKIPKAKAMPKRMPKAITKIAPIAKKLTKGAKLISGLKVAGTVLAVVAGVAAIGGLIALLVKGAKKLKDKFGKGKKGKEKGRDATQTANEMYKNMSVTSNIVYLTAKELKMNNAEKSGIMPTVGNKITTGFKNVAYSGKDIVTNAANAYNNKTISDSNDIRSTYNESVESNSKSNDEYNTTINNKIYMQITKEVDYEEVARYVINEMTKGFKNAHKIRVNEII